MTPNQRVGRTCRRQQAMLEAVREVHQKVEVEEGKFICLECETEYPCRTVAYMSVARRWVGMTKTKRDAQGAAPGLPPKPERISWNPIA